MIHSQAWDSTSRPLLNQNVNVTLGGSAYSARQNSSCMKSPQTQMMRSSPLISKKPFQTIEPTSYYHPYISQPTSYHKSYQNNHSLRCRDGDGTGIDAYELVITRIVKGSPLTHQLTTCRTSTVIRNSYSISRSKHELEEILSDIFKDFDSPSKSVSSNTFCSADVDDVLVSYAARALILMKTC
jgi:hypothetical protein